MANAKLSLRALSGRHDGQALAAKALLVALAATVLLYVIPYGHLIGYPLVLVSTIAHEMGHGIAGVLVGARFDSFMVHADASGVAHVVGYDGRWARAFVSAGGLCGPAVAAAGAFFAARRAPLARVVMIVAGAFLAFSLLWVVRNLFGWIAVGTLAAVVLGIGVKARAETAQAALVFLAVQLALSVFSRGDYLFVEWANTGSGLLPSDVSNMSTALFLPYWFWGALCGAFSVAVLALGVRSYLFAVVGGEPAPARRR
jgi:hypothetical protein